MTRGVNLCLVGSFVLVSLAGFGRGFFQSAEREPWRAEAEIACLKSGAVKESAELIRISPISGPGVCGAEYPLKVAALGESSGSFGFADDPRPSVDIGNQPRWPMSRPPPPQPQALSYPDTAMRQPGYGGAAPNAPISLTAPGVAPAENGNQPPVGGGCRVEGANPSNAVSEPARQSAARPHLCSSLFGTRQRRPAFATARPSAGEFRHGGRARCGKRGWGGGPA